MSELTFKHSSENVQAQTREDREAGQQGRSRCKLRLDLDNEPLGSLFLPQ